MDSCLKEENKNKKEKNSRKKKLRLQKKILLRCWYKEVKENRIWYQRNAGLKDGSY